MKTRVLVDGQNALDLNRISAAGIGNMGIGAVRTLEGHRVVGADDLRSGTLANVDHLEDEADFRYSTKYCEEPRRMPATHL